MPLPLLLLAGHRRWHAWHSVQHVHLCLCCMPQGCLHWRLMGRAWLAGVYAQGGPSTVDKRLTMESLTNRDSLSPQPELQAIH